MGFRGVIVSLDAVAVDEALNGTNSAWDRIFKRGDVFRASETHREYVRRRYALGSAPNMHPMQMIPSGSDNIPYTDGLEAHSTFAFPLTENGGLVASVGTLQIRGTWLRMRGRSKQLQPPVALCVGTIQVGIPQLDKSRIAPVAVHFL